MMALFCALPTEIELKEYWVSPITQACITRNNDRTITAVIEVKDHPDIPITLQCTRMEDVSKIYPGEILEFTWYKSMGDRVYAVKTHESQSQEPYTLRNPGKTVLLDRMDLARIAYTSFYAIDPDREKDIIDKILYDPSYADILKRMLRVADAIIAHQKTLVGE